MGDGDEILLGAVVEVALEALPLGVAGRDDARSGAPDLLLDLLAGGDVEPAEEIPERALGVVDDGRGPVDDEPLALRRDVLVLDDPRRVVRPHAAKVLAARVSTSSSAMKSFQNGRPIHDSSGIPAARSSARFTPSSVPSRSTRARKLGVERTTARLKSRSRWSLRSCSVRSVKSRTMRTNSSGPHATTRPS